MRKSVFLVMSAIVFLLASCDLFGGNITIYNSSSYPVTFEFSRGNRDIHSLSSGRTGTFSASTAFLERFSSEGRVSYRMSDRYTGEFFDTVPYLLEIRNTLSILVTVSERNGFMDMGEIIVNPHEVLTAGSIYTSRPGFITDPPARIDYAAGGSMMVVIIY